MIPGSEHAPIAALDPGGIRPATEHEAEAWSVIKHAADDDHGAYKPLVMVGQAVIWQLDVSIPDEQRVIWRVAALALGSHEREASRAFLAEFVDGWRLLIVPDDRLEFVTRRVVQGADIAHATAALCTHLWGPTQATP